MTSERIKEIQNKTAYPNSVSVQSALFQVWNECQNDINLRTCNNCKHISTKCDIFKNNYKYMLETRGLEICKNKFTCGLWEIKE